MSSLVEVCGREIRISGTFPRVAKLEADKYHFLEDPEPLLAALREHGSRIDLFTFMQPLPETTPKYSYPMEWDNLAVLPVTTFDHWWTEQLGFKARNKAKQAGKKGVVVKEAPFNDEFARGIWEIYNETPVRQARPFPHYGKNLETVHREAATFPDTSVFIGAYFEDQLIGFIKMVPDESGKQAGLMNIVSMVKHRDKAPTNALVVEAVRACANRGIERLVYSNFAYGKKQVSSISDFKERNGFQRIDLPRYWIPLSSMGSIAFRLGLHRRISERIPESIAARLRQFRKAWLERKFGPLSEAM